MRSVSNILTLSVISLALASCQTVKIPNIKVYKEIPFVDAPEGVFVESGTWKEGLVSAEEWKKKRPLMLMLDAQGWKAIKDSWYLACRQVGKNCNAQIESIDGLVKTLDSIAGAVVPLP